MAVELFVGWNVISKDTGLLLDDLPLLDSSSFGCAPAGLP